MPAVPALWRLKTPASLKGDAAAAWSAVVVSIDADAAPLLDSDASDGKDSCWRRYFCTVRRNGVAPRGFHIATATPVRYQIDTNTLPH